MNVFNKVALQGMKKSRTRTIVTIVGVVLSAAMMTAVITFGVSLLHYMTDGATQKYGDWHVAFLDADAVLLNEVINNDAMADTAAFTNIGYATFQNDEEDISPYFFIAGFEDKAFDKLPVRLLSGRRPENSNEVIISGRALKAGGISYALGDTLSLAVGQRTNGSEELGQYDSYMAGNETLNVEVQKTYTVVGICQTPVFETENAAGYTLITAVDDAVMTDDFSLFVTLRKPRSVYAFTDSMTEGHAVIYNNNVLRFMGRSRDPGDKLFVSLLVSIGMIVIAIIMIGSIFLIYNSFDISLNERMQQFGIFASVGATAKQLRGSVLFEGLCIGAVGIPIGIAVGLGSIGLVIAAVTHNFSNILYSEVPLTLHISAIAVATAAAVSLATILISAYLPARKAAGTPVMTCIRQTNEVKVAPNDVKTSKWMQRLCGLEGTLALKNFKRNRKRYHSIVLSLVLSIVLFISTSAFVIDLQQATALAKAVTSYDVGLGVQNMAGKEMLLLYDKLKTTEGVTDSSYQVVMQQMCTVQSSMLSDAFWETQECGLAGETVPLSVKIQCLDEAAYLKIIQDLGLPEAAYTGEDAKWIAVAKMQTDSDSAETAGQLKDLFAETSIEIVMQSETNDASKTAYVKNAKITCVDMTPPDMPPTARPFESQPYFFQIIVPYASAASFALPDTIIVKGLTFQSENPSLSMSEIEKMLQHMGTVDSYIIVNTSEMLEESRNYIFIANVFAYTFIVMISLIAVANVFNTIATNIKLRRREFAMLRSVGMSDRDFNRMMRYECVFYGLNALLVGLPLAVLIAWLIYKGMFIGGADGIVFVWPWTSIGISIISVLLVIFTTMTYAVSKIKKENIIDALRDDMM
ncbi:ABC transporter permease [Fusibacter paucivorans]|uniref:ABC transporter permease n=1 Tax=Fusibacter paucivorans TaxID=76009 RepID=A0ABS5PP72_9FIRM|nr:ABC transporter permease [Fusibacter paucivorans]MBS7526863.1 ABC transporter permease [Fusibacter paucivorans]